MNKKASIEFTTREIVVLVIVIIIAAIVVGIAVSKLGLIQKALEVLTSQGEVIAAA
jgi:hypothetical protein